VIARLGELREAVVAPGILDAKQIPTPRSTPTPTPKATATSNAQTTVDDGDYYFDLGEYQKAIEYYSEAIRLDPNHAGAYYIRGTAYSYLGQYERVI
jgi:tetratricopeptide (TPR) repeat protein